MMKMRIKMFECECIACGHKFGAEDHCENVVCPECGRNLCRRADRPGIGR
jgi:predicted RNA-binding Zn-ribbon protein involved in translation (DUF1610 family)